MIWTWFGLISITGSFSNVNVGFELGKEEQQKQVWFKENYANISISVSFIKRQWFKKENTINWPKFHNEN
jgi:hypothetical protein